MLVGCSPIRGQACEIRLGGKIADLEKNGSEEFEMAEMRTSEGKNVTFRCFGGKDA